jgi:hypothetical protein
MKLLIATFGTAGFLSGYSIGLMRCVSYPWVKYGNLALYTSTVLGTTTSMLYPYMFFRSYIGIPMFSFSAGLWYLSVFNFPIGGNGGI